MASVSETGGDAKETQEKRRQSARAGGTACVRSDLLTHMHGGATLARIEKEHRRLCSMLHPAGTFGVWVDRPPSLNYPLGGGGGGGGEG